MIKKHYEVYELDVNGNGTDVWQATWDKAETVIIYRGTKTEDSTNVTRMQNIHITRGKKRFTVSEFLKLVDDFITETVELENKYRS
jgi:hypothetical protein